MAESGRRAAVRRRERLLRRSATFLRVVILLADVVARTIEFALQVPALAPRHDAIGLGLALFVADMRLLGAQSGGFAPGQFAARDTFIDAGALIGLPLIDDGRVRARCAREQRTGDEEGQRESLVHRFSP
jgi:hypothetical protein